MMSNSLTHRPAGHEISLTIRRRIQPEALNDNIEDMLRELFIRNFAIIDDLRIQFDDGLTILSGETGAGKSVIINAVNLILGGRASSKLIRSGEKSAELEALFEINNHPHTATLMRKNDLDPQDGLIIRRIISTNDRHKVYINGRLSTLDVLTEITENLAGISGQHAHQILMKEEKHLFILDQFSGLTNDRMEVTGLHRKVWQRVQELDAMVQSRNRQVDKLDLMLFQKEEIEKAGITENEDENLENERLRLKHAEELYKVAHGGMETLYNSSGSVHEILNDVVSDMERASRIDSEIEKIAVMTRQIIFQIEDVNDQLRSYAKHIEMDDSRLEQIEDRLNFLNQMKKKYGGTLKSILEFQKNLESDLSVRDDIEHNISCAQKDLSELHSKLSEVVLRLSQNRKVAAIDMSHQVECELSELGMPHTIFRVDFESDRLSDGKLTPYLVADNFLIHEWGMDRVRFTISPNVGESVKPLTAIASGGELSRIILSLKVIMTRNDSIGTIVFDEVDAGIGGATAEAVGKKIAELSKYHQVICITHLPQIAKFGKSHFKIEKTVQDGRTRTTIERLGEQKRIEEMARMLGGSKITTATLDHAREMLRG